MALYQMVKNRLTRTLRYQGPFLFDNQCVGDELSISTSPCQRRTPESSMNVLPLLFALDA
jgi:hypothetical protein